MENISSIYPIPGEIWKHYKGGEYKIICMANDTTTNEPVVVYQSISFGGNHVRPFKEWHEQIPNLYICGYPVRRFIKE